VEITIRSATATNHKYLLRAVLPTTAEHCRRLGIHLTAPKAKSPRNFTLIFRFVSRGAMKIEFAQRTRSDRALQHKVQWMRQE